MERDSIFKLLITGMDWETWKKEQKHLMGQFELKAKKVSELKSR